MRPLYKIVKVFPREQYRLECHFENKERRLFDMSQLLNQSPFDTLRDPVAFRHVHIDDEAGTVAWLTGQDLSPSVIYDQGKPA
jgi:Protein of unknown function (DUF2442)